MKYRVRLAAVALFAATLAWRSCLGCPAAEAAGLQNANFIQVEGPTLSARFESTVKNASREYQGHAFWIGYSFPVRPGIFTDCGITIGPGVVMGKGLQGGKVQEVRDLEILFRYEGNRVEQARVFNLNREHDFGGAAVFWAGKVEASESVAFLKAMIDLRPPQEVGQICVTAIGLHEGPEAAPVLEELAGAAYREHIRSAAILEVGQFPGHCPFLSGLALDAHNSLELRKDAVFAIGASEDESALATLKSLYATATVHDLRKQLVFAVGVNKDRDAASFLIGLAKSESDTEIRKTAVFWMGQKAGDRTLEVLGDLAEANDENIEIQKVALFAISQRPKDEAIPLLIRVAKTHPRAQVRKQAMFCLGQTGDDRAISFLEEVLTR